MENVWIKFESINNMAPGEYLIRRYCHTKKTFVTNLVVVKYYETRRHIGERFMYDKLSSYTYLNADFDDIVAYRPFDVIMSENNAEFKMTVVDPISGFEKAVADANFSINSLDAFEWIKYRDSKPTKSGPYICITRRRRFNGEYAYAIEFETYKEDSDKWYFFTICEGPNCLCNNAIEPRVDKYVVYYASIPNGINLPDNIKEVVIYEQD